MKYLALLFLACAPALAQPAPCVVPATRDGPGILDAVAIAGPTGRVCLDAGDYIVATPQSPPGARRPYAVLAIGTTELYGAGPDITTVHFVGDAGMIDWHGITKTGGDMHDFTIETGSLTGTVEQTHAFRVFGPASPGRVYNMVFDHPVRHAADGSDLAGGDCMQFVGYPGALIVGWRIYKVVLRHCDRSGFAAHGGTEVEIADSEFHDTGDQDIDGEGGTGGNHHWVIARNTFMTGVHAQGDVAIQLQLADDVNIEENKFWGRGVFSYSSSHVRLANNLIVMDVPGGTSAIEIKKASSVTEVDGNTLVRTPKAGPGFLIRAAPQNNGTPDHLTIRGNTLAQSQSNDVINTFGMVGLTVEGNTVIYTGLPGKGYGVLAAGSAGAAPIRTDDIRVVGNTWIGPLAGCLGLSGGYGGTGAVTALSNVAMGPVAGIVCGGATTGQRILGPLMLFALGMLGNAWPAPSGCAGVPTL